MATFYGGEQLINTVVLSLQAGSTPAGTIYTCPSGRYSRATFKHIGGPGFSDINIDYASGISAPLIPTIDTLDAQKSVVLNSGDSIERASGNPSYEIFVEEFSLP